MVIGGLGDAEPAGYWADVLAGWEPSVAHRLWRAHSDAVNTRLVRRWLPTGFDRLLKTDLFDEAVATGLYPELAAKAAHVAGVDLSSEIVDAARRRYPGIDAETASVLALPFPDGSFDAIVSNSTLDHFQRIEMLHSALRELARVMTPGGTLLITLDNRLNPMIALRTTPRLGALHRRLGLVPYFVGVTCGPRGLARALNAAGFRVRELTAIMHCPPQLGAVIAERRCAAGAGGEPWLPGTVHWCELQRRHLGRVIRWERLER